MGAEEESARFELFAKKIREKNDDESLKSWVAMAREAIAAGDTERVLDEFKSFDDVSKCAAWEFLLESAGAWLPKSEIQIDSQELVLAIHKLLSREVLLIWGTTEIGNVPKLRKQPYEDMKK